MPKLSFVQHPFLPNEVPTSRVWESEIPYFSMHEFNFRNDLYPLPAWITIHQFQSRAQVDVDAFWKHYWADKPKKAQMLSTELINISNFSLEYKQYTWETNDAYSLRLEQIVSNLVEINAINYTVTHPESKYDYIGAFVSYTYKHDADVYTRSQSHNLLPEECYLNFVTDIRIHYVVKPKLHQVLVKKTKPRKVKV